MEEPAEAGDLALVSRLKALLHSARPQTLSWIHSAMNGGTSRWARPDT